MTKEEILNELSQRLKTGEITKDEINSLFDSPLPSKTSLGQRFSITKVLYVLGASIAVLGIIVFISQIWDDIGSVSRIAITLGLGFIMSLSGSRLLIQKPQENIGSVFHFIGGILIPIGAIVTLTEFSSITTSALPVAITFILISLYYLFLTLKYKNAVLTFFAVANSTVSLYLIIETLIADSYLISNDIYVYTTMIIGLSYIFLAQHFKNSWNNILCGLLQFAGITAFLGSAFIFVSTSVLWQFAYLILIAVGFYFSIIQKSKSILAISTLFLVIHIAFITTKYFANSVGWPVTLIFLGFMFIGLGYTSISINKKYITASTQN
jgi:hypothetical protein